MSKDKTDLLMRLMLNTAPGRVSLQSTYLSLAELFKG